MAIYLSLGSNRGDRRDNLRAALTELGVDAVTIERISPVVESPALLPADASPDWNTPFLNLVVECRSDLSPEGLLACIKRIETRLGRTDTRHWAPRPIDIDILTFDDRVQRTEALEIPHPELAFRPFVLTPLAALAPTLEIPGQRDNAFSLNASLGKRIPLWMGIVNLTPDSFSDGGVNQSWPEVEARIDDMVADGAHILDFGAESTRPGARPLSAAAEWARLEPILTAAIEKLRRDPLRPLISIDTYHAENAAKAIEHGADMINDVGGLTDPDMLRVAAESCAGFVAMHNLGLPADPRATLSLNGSAVDQVEYWLDGQIENWLKHGIDQHRIVFDPGIGFGKNPLQSLAIMRGIERLRRDGMRLLVGHSRKSFMKPFTGDAIAERDLATIGASLSLCARGVDILRVHNVRDHVSVWRGRAHVEPV